MNNKNIKELKVLYFSDCGPENTVFHSQVIGMVKAWATSSNVTLLYRSSKNSEKVFIEDNINIKTMRRLPNIGRFLWKVELLLGGLSNFINSFDIIHCRGPIATWQALSVVNNKSIKIIYDCRGAIVEELDFSRFNNNYLGFILNKLRRYEFSAIERKSLLGATITTSVTQALSDYMYDKYGKNADIIIPPLVNVNAFMFSITDRIEKRKSLQIGNNDKLFIFVGGSDGWQRLDYLRQWWDEHHEKYPYNKLLVLTHSVEQFSIYFNQNEASTETEEVIIKSVKHSEVPAYLSAADYALVFRDDSLTNRVSHPVKIAEYLVSGLRIITNEKYFKELAPKNIFLEKEIKSFEFSDEESRINNRWQKHYSYDAAIEKVLSLIY